ncbi:hypothetical protein N2152v2_008084 [Parachlorella kessleri]
MKLVAAYLLATLGGKDAPTAEDIKSILSSVGAEADEERLSKLLSELEGKNINDVVASGLSKLASVPAGGVASSGGAAPAAGGAGAAEAAAPKEEEKVEEEEEEDMGFSLFD